MEPFNLKKQADLNKEAGRRIRDRGIKWEEVYREKSDDLKRRFDKLIGSGSYFRWEGHDYTTDSDYFVVVGPAVTKNGKKKWFAGVKKLPKDEKKKHYAPSGDYFSNIVSALSHANEKWGTPFPKGSPNYDEGILQMIEIPRHIKG